MKRHAWGPKPVSLSLVSPNDIRSIAGVGVGRVEPLTAMGGLVVAILISHGLEAQLLLPSRRNGR